MGRGLAHYEVKASTSAACSEIGGIVQVFDNLKGASITQGTHHDLAFQHSCLVGSARSVRRAPAIDKEDLACGMQHGNAGAQKVVEPLTGDMREPESKKDSIVNMLRVPGEEISQHIADAMTGDFRPVDRQHFGGSINSCDGRGCAYQALCPDTRSGSQFEDFSCQVKGIQRGEHLIQFSEPACIHFRTSIIVALTTVAFI